MIYLYPGLGKTNPTAKTRFINAFELSNLYKVNIEECKIIYFGVGNENLKDLKFEVDDIHLFARWNGEYERSKK